MSKTRVIALFLTLALVSICTFRSVRDFQYVTRLYEFDQGAQKILSGQEESQENTSLSRQRTYKDLAPERDLPYTKLLNNSGYEIEERWKSINDTSVGIHFFSPVITQVRIIGERHSGTTFFTKYLKRCFPDVSVEDYFVRKKHWFQPSPQEVIEAAKAYGKQGLEPSVVEGSPFSQSWWEIAQSPNPKNTFNTTLVIALFREVYDWTEAMRRKPWHWPNHVSILPRNQTTITSSKYKNDQGGSRNRKRQQSRQRNLLTKQPGGRLLSGVTIHKSFVEHFPLPWREFVRREMRLLDYKDDNDSAGGLCQKGFARGRVSPCMRNISYVPKSVEHIPKVFLRHLPFDINDVVYELSETGAPFRHPLEIRAAKIESFLRLPVDWEVGGFGLITYDKILGDRLTPIAAKVARALNAQSYCTSEPPLLFEKKPYQLSEDFHIWIVKQTRWDLEARLGLKPREWNER